MNVHDSAVPRMVGSAGFDSDAIKGDPHLPSSGPGRGFSGVFEITKRQVIDVTGPPLSVPNSGTQPVMSSRAFTFRLSSKQCGWNCGHHWPWNIM